MPLLHHPRRVLRPLALAALLALLLAPPALAKLIVPPALGVIPPYWLALVLAVLLAGGVAVWGVLRVRALVRAEPAPIISGSAAHE